MRLGMKIFYIVFFAIDDAERVVLVHFERIYNLKIRLVGRYKVKFRFKIGLNLLGVVPSTDSLAA